MFGTSGKHFSMRICRGSSTSIQGQTFTRLGIAGDFGRRFTGLAWHPKCGVRRCEQVMDSRGWQCLQSVPNVFYLPAEDSKDGHYEHDASSVCHGDDFLAEGSERILNELDGLLRQHFEVTAGDMIGPGRPRQARYLKRIIGYTEDLP